MGLSIEDDKKTLLKNLLLKHNKKPVWFRMRGMESQLFHTEGKTLNRLLSGRPRQIALKKIGLIFFESTKHIFLKIQKEPYGPFWMITM